LFYLLPSYARGGCGGHGGGHCGGHCCSHGGGHSVVFVRHCPGDTTNRYMLGVGWLDDGDIIYGRFSNSTFLPGVYVSYRYSLHNGTSIPVKTIARFVVTGSDTLLSYRKDSTEYCHIENHNYMSRKLTSGKIEVYERSDLTPEERGWVSNQLTVKYYGLVVYVGSVKRLDRMMRTLIPEYAQTHALNKKKQINIVSLFKAINKFNSEG
jgi:hypothetical protein